MLQIIFKGDKNMKTQTVKYDKYMALSAFRRREREKRLQAQLLGFFLSLFTACGILVLIISSIPY